MIRRLTAKEINLLPIYVHSAASYKHQNAITRVPAVSLKNIQLSFCRNGEGVFIDSSNKKHTIQKGSLFYFRPGLYHSYEPSSYPWSIDYIVFNGYMANKILDQFGFGQDGVIYPPSDFFDKISASFSGIVKNYLDGDNLSPSKNSREIFSMLHQLSKFISNESVDLPAKEAIIAAQCAKYIEKNYIKSFSISDIADDLGISMTKLIELFRQAYDTTPQKYLAEVRLNTAKTALVYRRLLKLSEIAKMCGYSSTNYFCTVFKKNTGMTPEEYRQANSYESF